MRRRLSLLMFLTYAPPGAVLPFFTLRLDKELHFTPMAMAVCCATQALGAVLAPLVVGQVADRWVAADRCLAACALAAGTLLWVLAATTGPVAVFLASLGFWLLMAPAMTLCATVSFIHLASPEREFGSVRLWGTMGWVVQGWLVGAWFALSRWLPDAARVGVADAFRLGGLMAFALGLYALTLPRTPPRRRFDTRLAPLAALRLMRDRSFATFLACSLGLCLTIPFATQNTPLLLEHLGVPRVWLGPVQTIAQSTEVVALGLLPLLLTRFGQRRVMILGLLAWLTALTVQAVGWPLGLVVASLSLNGLCICCYLVAGQVFVNSQAASDFRASAQALMTFTVGLGMLGGNLLAGRVRELASERFTPIFGVAAALAGLLVVVFSAGFRPGKSAAGPQ